MHTNILNVVIAILVSALLAYGFWNIGGALANYLAVGSFIFFAGTLIPGIGLNSSNTRIMVNKKVLAGLFFIIGIIINIAFSLFFASSVFYILLSAITYLIFIFLTNGLQNIEKKY